MLLQTAVCVHTDSPELSVNEVRHDTAYITNIHPLSFSVVLPDTIDLLPW